mgnify:CR=1 FL=1
MKMMSTPGPDSMMQMLPAPDPPKKNGVRPFNMKKNTDKLDHYLEDLFEEVSKDPDDDVK